MLRGSWGNSKYLSGRLLSRNKQALIKKYIKWLSCLDTFCSIFLLISSNKRGLLHPLGITRFVPVSSKISCGPPKLSHTDGALVGLITALVLYLIECCLIVKILLLIKDATNPKLVTARNLPHGSTTIWKIIVV